MRAGTKVQAQAGRYERGHAGASAGMQMRARAGRYESRQADTSAGRQIRVRAGRYERGWAGTSVGTYVRARVGMSAHGECSQPHLLYQITSQNARRTSIDMPAVCGGGFSSGRRSEPAGTSSTAGFDYTA